MLGTAIIILFCTNIITLKYLNDKFSSINKHLRGIDYRVDKLIKEAQ